MVTVTKLEIAMAVAGAITAFAAWPIGDAAGSIGKMVITFGALGALLVSLITLLIFHHDFEQMAIEVFRKEVSFFIPFGICAIIVMALTV